MSLKVIKTKICNQWVVHRFLWGIVLTGLICSCASKVLDYKNVRKLEENVEYDKLIQVKEIPGQKIENTKDEPLTSQELKTEESQGDGPTSQMTRAKTADSDKGSDLKRKPETPVKEVTKVKPVVKLQPNTSGSAKGTGAGEPGKRLPEHEDLEGFQGRRPVHDPFRVGENVRLSVTYFRMTAGFMDLKVNPFVEVNGEKAYAFEVDLTTSSFFSRIYTVDDQAKSYLDYKTLLPYNLSIKVRESKQIKEVRSVFNHNDLKATYWEKKVKKGGKEKEKNVEWDIEEYSQNVVTALYYLRTFTLTPGKDLQFRVADAGKNYMFTGKVLRREKLKTEIGVLDTVVVQPKITINGMFKQVGEILFWLTDDERKFPVRIESEIKIGTLVAKVKSIDKGQP